MIGCFAAVKPINQLLQVPAHSRFSSLPLGILCSTKAKAALAHRQPLLCFVAETIQFVLTGLTSP